MQLSSISQNFWRLLNKQIFLITQTVLASHQFSVIKIHCLQKGRNAQKKSMYVKVFYIIINK